MFTKRKHKNFNNAYSLLNSGNAINDIRASFILRITALEALVSDKQKKNDNYQKLINAINKKFSKI